MPAQVCIPVRGGVEMVIVARGKVKDGIEQGMAFLALRQHPSTGESLQRITDALDLLDDSISHAPNINYLAIGGANLQITKRRLWIRCSWF